MTRFKRATTLWGLVSVAFLAATASAFSHSRFQPSPLPTLCLGHAFSSTSGDCQSRLLSTTTCRSVFAMVVIDTVGAPVPPRTSTVARMRQQLAGVSVTALRTTIRTATGVSLTALYASTVAVSGVWIRQVMRLILSIFPSWARYFVQPFLVLYYVPLYMLRSVSSPKTKNENVAAKGWYQPVETLDQRPSYWPLDVNSATKYIDPSNR
jgi:hypothetical protein